MNDVPRIRRMMMYSLYWYERDYSFGLSRRDLVVLGTRWFLEDDLNWPKLRPQPYRQESSWFDWKLLISMNIYSIWYRWLRYLYHGRGWWRGVTEQHVTPVSSFRMQELRVDHNTILLLPWLLHSYQSMDGHRRVFAADRVTKATHNKLK